MTNEEKQDIIEEIIDAIEGTVYDKESVDEEFAKTNRRIKKCLEMIKILRHEVVELRDKNKELNTLISEEFLFE